MRRNNNQLKDKQADGIGARLPRKEDIPILRGEGHYFSDIAVERQLHVMFLRSVHAHARILSIDTSAASKMPGVVAVVTGAMLQDEIVPLPQASTSAGLPGRLPTFWPLAVDKVKFHGEPVAAVVAETPYLAEDALEGITVEYEPLPYVGDMEAALEPSSPLVHEDWNNNEIFRSNYQALRTADEHAAHIKEARRRIAEAPFVVKQRFRTHRCGVTALEPRGALAVWDNRDGLTIWMTTQRPHAQRACFADVLRLPLAKVRVITPRNQGGGFGMKASVYREPLLVAHLARCLRRPVRWLETREENLMSAGQERDQIHDLELAADAEGNLMALADRIVADAGDACLGGSWAFPIANVGGLRLPNAYQIPFCDVELRVAVTNKASLCGARGLGIYPARFAMERAIDMLSWKIGMEPAEFRRKNFITTFPARLATGLGYSNGDFLKTFDRLIETLDIAAFRERQKEAWSQGRFLGLGIAVGAEVSGVDSLSYVSMMGTPSYASVEVRVDPEGHVQIFYGDGPSGQGEETTIAQVVAEELGIDSEHVSIIVGDTQTSTFAPGTVASRGAAMVLPSVAMACRNLKKKIVRVLAHDVAIAADEDEFIFADGYVMHRGNSNIRLSFAELAFRIVMKPINLPPGDSGGLDERATFESTRGNICFGAHAAFVEVWPETGRVKIERYVTSDDAGVVINPLIVEGQIQGGVVQGISNFFFEEYVYDDQGQQMTSTLEAYKIATAADVPRIEMYHDAGTPNPTNPLGTRGIGEGCIAPVPGALGNAISDALRPLGIEITDLPVRPPTLFRQIDASRQSKQQAS
jgi:aerobic carbon-monoxide dehydrogenase large subunit